MQVEYVIPPPQPVFLNPTDSALILVDMQNGLFKKEGSPLVERGKPVIAAALLLLNQFRSAGGKVVFVQSMRSPDAPRIAGCNPDLVEGTWEAELIEELAPQPGEAIVRKDSYDPFNHTVLESLLCELDLRPCRSQIVVAGAPTHVSYDCAVTGFRVRGFAVYLPIDATTSGTDQQMLLGLRHMLGIKKEMQYNTQATRSDLITMDASQLGSDPIYGSMTPNELVFTDPLYKAITTLTFAD
jgi:nicotinamidase-related amidase